MAQQFTPFRTGDSKVDRNLDLIKAALDNVNNAAANTPQYSTYPLRILGAATNPTKGLVTRDIAAYFEWGGMMTITYNFSQTTAGAAGSGLYTFPLPPNRAFDEQFVFNGSTAGLGALGIVQLNANGASYNGAVVTASPTTMSLKMQDPTAGSGSLFDVNSSNAPLSTPNLNYSFTATFPVKRI